MTAIDHHTAPMIDLLLAAAVIIGLLWAVIVWAKQFDTDEDDAW